jgi:hypothetical protein
MKVIHFITDDKFLNAAIKLFEEIHELDNRYINIVFDKDVPFEYISSDKVERINISNIHDIITNPVCDVIVLHNLSSLPCEYIKQINEKIKVVWLSWGFDIYNNKKPQFPLVSLKNQIKPHTISPRYRIRLLNEGRRLFFKNLKNYDAKGRQDFIDAVHRVDYYSGVFPIEYDLLKKNSFFRAKQLSFSYPSDKEFKSSDVLYQNIFPKGNAIQISHSATVYANHRNTFWRLRHLNLHNRKIMVPLSYAGNSLYKATVCKMGKRLFGNNFVPITTFMKYDEYVALTESVSVAIHNTVRQIASGNIIINMWNGAKVFMPEGSINYKFFKGLGFHVFSIEKELNQTEIDTLLSKEDIIENRKLVLKHHTYEVSKEKAINSFRQIANDI